jgi:lipopolysaccharide transport system permease protein
VFWFYLTPIFYDVDKLPSSVGRWFSLNPMSAIVSAHRTVTLYGRFPSWTSLASVTVVSVGIVVASLLIFRTLEDAFIEQL